MNGSGSAPPSMAPRAPRRGADGGPVSAPPRPRSRHPPSAQVPGLGLGHPPPGERSAVDLPAPFGSPIPRAASVPRLRFHFHGARRLTISKIPRF